MTTASPTLLKKHLSAEQVATILTHCARGALLSEDRATFLMLCDACSSVRVNRDGSADVNFEIQE